MAETLGSATVKIKVDIPALKKDLKVAQREVKAAQKRLNSAMGSGGTQAGSKVGSNFSKGFSRALTNFISSGGKGGMASIGAEGGAALLGGMSVAIVAGAAVVVAAVAIVAKVAFVSLKAFIETEKKLLRLKAAFRSTGQAAGFSAEQIRRFVLELSRTSLTPTNEMLEAAAIISTFQNIVGESFKKAIVVSNDMAIAMGVNQKSAALQLAKALAQPITGMQSLREVGILFTDEEKDLIVEMERAGKTAEFQNEIFKILAKNGLDGNSKATETLSGQVAQLTNAYEDLKSGIGELLAATGGLADQLKGMAVITRGAGTITRDLADAIKDAKDEANDFWDVLEDGIGPIDGLQRGFDGLGNVFQKFIERREEGIADLNAKEAEATQKTISMMDKQLQHALNAMGKLESAEKTLAANRKRRGAQAILEDELSTNLKIGVFEKRIKKERDLMSKAEKDRDKARKTATQEERADAKIIDNEIARIDDLIKKEKEKAAVKQGISFGTSESKFEQVNKAVIADATKRDEDAKKARLKALQDQKESAQELRKVIRERSIAVRERADQELVDIREAHQLRMDLLQKQFKARKDEMRKLIKLFMEEFDINILRRGAKETAEIASAEVGATAKGTRGVTTRIIIDNKIVESEVSKKNRENAAKALSVAGQRLLDINKKLEARNIGSDLIEKEGQRLLQMGAEAARIPGAGVSGAGKVGASQAGQDKQLTQGDKMIRALKFIGDRLIPGRGVFGGN